MNAPHMVSKVRVKIYQEESHETRRRTGTRTLSLEKKTQALKVKPNIERL